MGSLGSLVGGSLSHPVGHRGRESRRKRVQPWKSFNGMIPARLGALRDYYGDISFPRIDQQDIRIVDYPEAKTLRCPSRLFTSRFLRTFLPFKNVEKSR